MRCARAEFQDAAVSAIRAFRHTRVDQCKRHLHTHTNVDQRRPYFRINHHAQRRPVTRQKTLDRKWHVIRQIATQRAPKSASPIARPLGVICVIKTRLCGCAASHASTSGCAARVSPTDTACTHSSGAGSSSGRPGASPKRSPIWRAYCLLRRARHSKRITAHGAAIHHKARWKKWSNTLVWFCKCGRLNLHTRPFNAVAVEPAARCVCAPVRSPALEHFSVDWPKERARRQYGDRCGRSRSPSQSNGGDPAAIPNTLSREATQGKSLKNALIRARHDGYSTE